MLDSSRMRLSLEAGNLSIRNPYVIAGRWRERSTTDPAQPPAGFTVSAVDTKSDVALLREAYELGDASSRHVLRRMAAMSIGSTGDIAGAEVHAVAALEHAEHRELRADTVRS